MQPTKDNNFGPVRMYQRGDNDMKLIWEVCRKISCQMSYIHVNKHHLRWKISQCQKPIGNMFIFKFTQTIWRRSQNQAGQWIHI